MLGDEVVDSVRIENHDARDEHAAVYRSGRQRRAALAQPHLARRRRAHHHRLRRAALLRRLLGRPEDDRARPRRARDDARAARRGAHRQPAGALGRARGQPRARRHPRDRPPLPAGLLARRRARRAQARRAGLRGRAVRDARGGGRGLASDRDVSRAGGVRRRRHVERGLSARPEPVPGGQGHVGRGAGRQARRDDRDRGRVPRRLPGSRQLPQRARRSVLARRAARADRRSAADGRRPVADPDPGEDPGARPRARAHVVPLRCGARRRAPRAGARRVRGGASRARGGGA